MSSIYMTTYKSLKDTVPIVNDDAQWSAVRQAKNWQNNGFLFSATSIDIHCNQLSLGKETLSIAAR
jgi:hypothetical protein